LLRKSLYSYKIKKDVMNKSNYNLSDSIFALATPRGESAIAVIRISGDDISSKIASLLSNPEKLLNAGSFSIIRSVIMAPDTKNRVDDVLIGIYKAPKSYTGQDCLELFCHGSLPGIEKIMSLLRSIGFRDAEPGEFTLRAFLNQKLDLTRAEAVNEIIKAKTRQAHSLALNRLSGGISGIIAEIKEKLVNLMASLSVCIDYPEDEVDFDDEKSFCSRLDETIEALSRLFDTYRIGKIFQKGVSLVIAGSTNAGKSMLFNLFLREDRSIVSDTHGTTRDYIESWISIEGIPVRIFDTAGIREAENSVEKEGIKRSELIMEKAEIVLYLVDGVNGLEKFDIDFLEKRKGDSRIIKVWNKIDMDIQTPDRDFISISAKTGEGLKSLEKEIISRLFPSGAVGTENSRHSVVIDSERQKILIERTIRALKLVKCGFTKNIPFDLIAVDLKEAIEALGEITGETASVDILNQMFSNFCVGK